MFKRSQLFWSLLLSPLLASSMTFAKPLVKIAADEWMPYTGAPGDSTEGLTVKLTRHILETAGFEVNYSLVPWNRALKLCQEGKLDLLLVMYKEDADSAGLLVHKEPMGYSQNKFFTAKTSSWTYQGPASLKGQKLGVIDGYSYAGLDDYIQEHKKSDSLQVSFGNDPVGNNLKMLIKGRISVLLEDELVIQNKAQSLGLDAQLREAGSLGGPHALFAGLCPKASIAPEKLAETLDAGLKARKAKTKTISP